MQSGPWVLLTFSKEKILYSPLFGLCQGADHLLILTPFMNSITKIKSIEALMKIYRLSKPSIQITQVDLAAIL